MIQQRPGDLLEIELDGNFFYVVVLTKIVQFGGNIVFAFHTDGSKRTLSELGPDGSGFNVCTDLLWPKKSGNVGRLHHFTDLSGFWRTKHVKSTHAYKRGEKAKLWFVHNIDDPRGPSIRYKKLPRKYRSAMDSPTYSFDLVAEKILQRYSPEQNEHL